MPDSIRAATPDLGLFACVAGFLAGIVASTLLISRVDGVLRLAGIGLILAGLGTCLFVLEDPTPDGPDDRVP